MNEIAEFVDDAGMGDDDAGDAGFDSSMDSVEDGRTYSGAEGV